jgi:acyl-CoA synthetase (NDP forming)/RimJ/RimL family protein N-acetyltransferase
MSLHRALTKGRFRPESIFQPESLAVLGADSRAGREVMANLLEGAFKGAILPVTTEQLDGLLTYRDIEALPMAADLAVICDDGIDALDVFTRLAKRGIFCAVVIGMVEHVRAAALATGVRALGPGSFGICIPRLGLHATRSHLRPKPGRVALVSQSAALCRAVLDWAEPNGVGFSHVIGIGGNTDIGFSNALDWLSRDPGTGAILMDIRLIRDPRRFLSGARAASRLRPVVAMRAGGLLIDPTGAADAAFEAALRRAGVLVVDRLEDMLAAAETLTLARPARGPALAIVTNAIGPAQMAADAALRDGNQLAELSAETRAVMQLLIPRAFGPASASLAPGRTGDIVYVGTDNPMRLAEAASMLSGAREVGAVMIVHAPTGPADAAAIAGIAAASATIKAPILACVMGETTGAQHRRQLAEAGVPAFATPEQAVRGFHHLIEDRRNRAAARELPPSAVLTIAPEVDAVRAIFAKVRSEGRVALTQAERVDVLHGYGLTLVASTPRVAVGDDAIFGPTIRFGHAVDLPPLNLPLAHALIDRSGLATDVADMLVRISQLIVDFPEIAILEIDGETVLLALRAPGEPPGYLALPPYPAELVGQFDAGGERLTIRPIRPEDAEAHGAFFNRLSAEDIRFRFFSAMRQLSAEQMARMTQVDYTREMAFVAVREDADGVPQTLGVARLVCENDEAAEFAVIVQPDMKGRGLARHLMERLIDWGRKQGLERITGQILSENRPMLAFIRRLGFTIHHVPDEPDVVEAALVL